MRGVLCMYHPKRKDIRKDCVIGVRLTKSEMQRVKSRASASRISLSSWAREIINAYLDLNSDDTKKEE